MPDFLKLAQEAYEASTTYIDANYRKDWDYSIRAFRSEHAVGSKYLSSEFQSRSRLYRPKTRSIIRKQEAAAAVALFSNMDVVDISAGNPDNLMNVASAACMKEILQYRLTKTIPSFPLVMGGIQDAQVQGAVCSYQYWEFQRKGDKIVKDKPCIELRPIENIRLDAGASWLDPVESTPYFADIIPMYVCDVKAMMASTDEKTGSPKWKALDEKTIAKAMPSEIDTTRQARNGTNQDRPTEAQSVKSFDIVWVIRWFIRNSQGDDYCFYTMGTEDLLTDPLPIDEVYFHGKRPYVIGSALVETHKPLKTTIPTLVKSLQMEANDVANQRLDNVKFVLNKRWLVARGRQVDVQSLVRNVPGGVTLVTDPKTDIQESNWPDVTSSAYVEQDRINADFDEIAGNFSPSTKYANKGVNDTLGGSRILSQSSGVMADYMLRTIIETWWEPVLRQIVMLEQYYETDSVVLGVCAEKARLFPKFGLSQITDDMLMREITVNVNVGMGASNPDNRFQKFMTATQAAIQLATTAPPGFNVTEGIKEIYSNAGYRDGSRFFSEKADPRLIQAVQHVNQLQQLLQGKQMELQMQARLDAAKLQSSHQLGIAKIQTDASRINGDLRLREAEFALEAAKVDLEKLKLEIEVSDVAAEHNARMVEIGAEVQTAQLKLEQERQKVEGQAMKVAAEIEKAQLQLATVKKEKSNEDAIGEVAGTVTKSMSEVMSDIMAIKQSLQTHAMGLSQMNKGLGAVVGVMMQPKRRAKGFVLKKGDGKKTNAVVVNYDDGSTDELAVG